jgi:hypothetical protein
MSMKKAAAVAMNRHDADRRRGGQDNGNRDRDTDKDRLTDMHGNRDRDRDTEDREQGIDADALKAVDFNVEVR